MEQSEEVQEERSELVKRIRAIEKRNKLDDVREIDRGIGLATAKKEIGFGKDRVLMGDPRVTIEEVRYGRKEDLTAAKNDAADLSRLLGEFRDILTDLPEPAAVKIDNMYFGYFIHNTPGHTFAELIEGINEVSSPVYNYNSSELRKAKKQKRKEYKADRKRRFEEGLDRPKERKVWAINRLLMGAEKSTWGFAKKFYWRALRKIPKSDKIVSGIYKSMPRFDGILDSSVRVINWSVSKYKAAKVAKKEFLGREPRLKLFKRMVENAKMIHDAGQYFNNLSPNRVSFLDTIDCKFTPNYAGLSVSEELKSIFPEAITSDDDDVRREHPGFERGMRDIFALAYMGYMLMVGEEPKIVERKIGEGEDERAVNYYYLDKESYKKLVKAAGAKEASILRDVLDEGHYERGFRGRKNRELKVEYLVSGINVKDPEDNGELNEFIHHKTRLFMDRQEGFKHDYKKRDVVKTRKRSGFLRWTVLGSCLALAVGTAVISLHPPTRNKFENRLESAVSYWVKSDTSEQDSGVGPEVSPIDSIDETLEKESKEPEKTEEQKKTELKPKKKTKKKKGKSLGGLIRSMRGNRAPYIPEDISERVYKLPPASYLGYINVKSRIKDDDKGDWIKSIEAIYIPPYFTLTSDGKLIVKEDKSLREIYNENYKRDIVYSLRIRFKDNHGKEGEGVLKFKVLIPYFEKKDIGGGRKDPEILTTRDLIPGFRLEHIVLERTRRRKVTTLMDTKIMKVYELVKDEKGYWDVATIKRDKKGFYTGSRNRKTRYKPKSDRRYYLNFDKAEARAQKLNESKK